MVPAEKPSPKRTRRLSLPKKEIVDHVHLESFTCIQPRNDVFGNALRGNAISTLSNALAAALGISDPTDWPCLL
jgi:hypothetical protein